MQRSAAQRATATPAEARLQFQIQSLEHVRQLVELRCSTRRDENELKLEKFPKNTHKTQTREEQQTVKVKSQQTNIQQQTPTGAQKKPTTFDSAQKSK